MAVSRVVMPLRAIFTWIRFEHQARRGNQPVRFGATDRTRLAGAGLIQRGIKFEFGAALLTVISIYRH